MREVLGTVGWYWAILFLVAWLFSGKALEHVGWLFNWGLESGKWAPQALSLMVAAIVLMLMFGMVALAIWLISLMFRER